MDIKRTVALITKKYGSNDPFEIAGERGIQILPCRLKTTLGYYTKYHRIQSIVLNDSLGDMLRRFVCAHELGHAVCHENLNTQWLKANTLFSTDRIEREASSFAVELLLPDSMVMEYAGESAYSIAKMTGIPSGLISLKKFNINKEHLFQ